MPGSSIWWWCRQGRTFPPLPDANFIEFLRHGGAFLSTGGYAFNDLVREVDGHWRPETEVVREARDRGDER